MRERWDSQRGSIHRDGTLQGIKGCVNVFIKPYQVREQGRTRTGITWQAFSMSGAFSGLSRQG